MEVVEQDAALLGLLTPVLDDDARAVDDLASVALAVDLACKRKVTLVIRDQREDCRQSLGVELTETGPLAELLAVGDLDQRDLVLGAQRHDELLVCLLLASLVEHAHVRLSPIQRLAGFTQTASETVVDESVLQDLLCSPENGVNGRNGHDLWILKGRT